MLKLTEICNRVAAVEINCRTGVYNEEPFVVIDVEAVTTNGDYIIDGYRYCTTDTRIVYEAIKRFVEKHFVCDEYFATDYHFSVDSNKYCTTEKYSFDLHTVEKL